MKIGIVGLPNVGKSSVFNLLTDAGADTQTYPFTTIDANHGMAPLPDPVLVSLGRLLEPARLTPAQIEVVDIAGLIKNAHQGEGLGNQFLAHIRDVDLVLHLIRGFEGKGVAHVFETLDPLRDREIILTELGLADLEIVQRRLARLSKQPEAREQTALLERFKKRVSQGAFSLNGTYTSGDADYLKSLGLLLPRPRIDVLNLGEEAASAELEGAYRISVSLEQALDEFSPEERRQLRKEAGADPRGAQGLAEEARKKLGLLRFYTVKGEEVRAWLLPLGSTALQAAQKIHTDIAQGFIKAEVAQAEDLVEAGSWHEAAAKGWMKVEGKDYPVKDSDVILVKFR